MTSHIPLPLSPSTSEPSDSSLNLKQSGGTQPAVCFADEDYLADWDARFNRRSVPLMPRWAFENLIASVVEQIAAQGDISVVEAEVARRMQQETDRLEEAMEDIKLNAFLAPPNALQNELTELLAVVRETTVQGHAQFVVAVVSLIRRLHDGLSASASSSEPSSLKRTALKSTPPGRTPRKRSKNSEAASTRLRRNGRIAKKRRLDRSLS